MFFSEIRLGLKKKKTHKKDNFVQVNYYLFSPNLPIIIIMRVNQTNAL